MGFVKMTHSVDMVSTGICLNENGWFGKPGKREKCRIFGFCLFTLAVTAVKLMAVLLVTESLLKAYFNPGGTVVKLQEFINTNYKPKSNEDG
jgi:hypothetical protein